MVEPVSPSRINFGWLVRLRFATVAGQALTIVAVRFGMNLEIPLAPLFALVGLALAVQPGVHRLRAGLRRREDWWLLAVMALDVLIFSGLLYFTGGPENPFSFLYLVPIAIAAITLRSAWTWTLVLLSLASSLVLFARHEPLPASGGSRRAHGAAPARDVGGVRRGGGVHRLLPDARAPRARRRARRSWPRRGAWPRGRSGSPRWRRWPRARRTSWPRRCRPSRSWPRTSSATWSPPGAPAARGRRRAADARGGRALPADPGAHARRRRRSGGRAVRAGLGARARRRLLWTTVRRSSSAPSPSPVDDDDGRGGRPPCPATPSDRRCAAWSTTPARPRPRARRSRCGSRPTTTAGGWSSRSPIAAPASRPMSWPASASRSSPPSRPDRGWASASSWRARSSSGWGGSSRSARRPARARPRRSVAAGRGRRRDDGGRHDPARRRRRGVPRAAGARAARARLRRRDRRRSRRRAAPRPERASPTSRSSICGCRGCRGWRCIGPLHASRRTPASSS